MESGSNINPTIKEGVTKLGGENLLLKDLISSER
jgi:hypothetical protein